MTDISVAEQSDNYELCICEISGRHCICVAVGGRVIFLFCFFPVVNRKLHYIMASLGVAYLLLQVLVQFYINRTFLQQIQSNSTHSNFQQCKVPDEGISFLWSPATSKTHNASCFANGSEET